MILLFSTLGLAGEPLSAPCVAAREAAHSAWRSAALPLIERVAGCGGDTNRPECVAAVDELAALGVVADALGAEVPGPRAALADAVAKAKAFLTPRSVETYATPRASLAALEHQCAADLAAGGR